MTAGSRGSKTPNAEMLVENHPLRSLSLIPGYSQADIF